MSRILSRIAALRDCQSGVAMVEMALVTPLIMGLVMWGIELGQLAKAQHQVSQAASALADNMSRVGLQTALASVQLRESDIIDGFIGLSRQTENSNLTAKGRVTLSSLEQNSAGGQWIHWQRCIGAKNYPSTFGVAGNGSTGTAFPGMGPPASRVRAPAGAAVMFVEVAYEFQPTFGTIFLSPRVVRAHNSFVARSERDLTQVYNPTGDIEYSCDRFTAT
jgi:TadE-like protein